MAAPTPVLTTLVDSYDDIMVKCIIPTGGDADISASTLIDISTFTTGRTVTSCKIKKIHSSLVGFSIKILEDADTDVHLLSIAEYINESDLGYPIPMTGATGSTGDIKFTTVGIGTADHGHFIIHCIK